MTHYMTLNRLDGNDTEVDVEYTISPFYPATWDDPAEGGEVEIVKVTCTHCGSEVKHTDAEDAKWSTHIAETHEHDTGPDPDDERDRRMDDKLTA